MRAKDNCNNKLSFITSIPSINSTIEVYNVMRNKSTYFIRYYINVDQLCDYNGIVDDTIWFTNLRQNLIILYKTERFNIITNYVNKLIHITQVLYNIEQCKDIMYVITKYVTMMLPEAHYLSTL